MNPLAMRRIALLPPPLVIAMAGSAWRCPNPKCGARLRHHKRGEWPEPDREETRQLLGERRRDDRRPPT